MFDKPTSLDFEILFWILTDDNFIDILETSFQRKYWRKEDMPYGTLHSQNISTCFGNISFIRKCCVLVLYKAKMTRSGHLVFFVSLFLVTYLLKLSLL